ncbi:hypothetical protein PoB_005979400 [Plakobranchus ocellatus]|uniref:Uncharacterized protein n=1 Tax=Plakobranchus ocellatus TaxID=259542 RepID=A0AAV4CKA3_9GAST|nr:hypothetical protein PoB_005979400 [Plakobranchus ocellatus]
MVSGSQAFLRPKRSGLGLEPASEYCRIFIHNPVTKGSSFDSLVKVSRFIQNVGVDSILMERLFILLTIYEYSSAASGPARQRIVSGSPPSCPDPSWTGGQTADFLTFYTERHIVLNAVSR